MGNFHHGLLQLGDSLGLELPGPKNGPMHVQPNIWPEMWPRHGFGELPHTMDIGQNMLYMFTICFAQATKNKTFFNSLGKGQHFY